MIQVGWRKLYPLQCTITYIQVQMRYKYTYLVCASRFLYKKSVCNTIPLYYIILYCVSMCIHIRKSSIRDVNTHFKYKIIYTLLFLKIISNQLNYFLKLFWLAIGYWSTIYLFNLHSHRSRWNLQGVLRNVKDIKSWLREFIFLEGRSFNFMRNLLYIKLCKKLYKKTSN